MRADGKIVVANRTRNADLFWAMRGGTGNNFAVLLTVTYQLYPLADIYGMQITWNIDSNIDNAALALYTIQENYLMGDSFPNLGIETVLTTDATDKHKKVFFCGAWIGSEADMNKALAPLLAIEGATITINEKGPYSKINNDLLESCPVLPDDVKAFSQSTYLERALSVLDWKNILTFFKTAPNQYTMIDMEGYGGKINTVLEADCAFVHRNVTMDFFCDAFYNNETNDKQQNEEWLASLMQFMNSYNNGHSYQNYPNRNQTDYKWAYWGNYYNTLVAIKNKYDPSNFFHYLQSIGEPIEEKHQSTQIVLFETPTPIQYEAY
jgi:FAD/FMN-containing dehydrogenase